MAEEIIWRGSKCWYHTYEMWDKVYRSHLHNPINRPTNSRRIEREKVRESVKYNQE